MDFGARLESVRTQLGARDLPALLVSDAFNLRWITGFTGSSAWLVVSESAATLVTDGRYTMQAGAELDAAGLTDAVTVSVGTDAGWDRVLQSVASCPVLGVEAASLSWADARRLEEGLDTTLVPTHGLVEALRMTKEPEEIEVIAAAVALADAALTTVVAGDWVGRTEMELAAALEWEARGRGASGTSFPTIVASGPHGALPHATPRAERIEAGAPVVVDFGCLLDGYCSDATRTVVWGEVPDDLAAIHAVVAAAQDAARDETRAGADCRAVDAAARSVIEEAGWGDHFVHGTGHGVGLAVHEPPRIAATSDMTLETGFVVTIEPGIYVPGLGGVRIEDLVVVGESGCRTLTSLPRGLADLTA
ncbi:MAG: aminopeptidase P family protein [Acidimicrobiia bacterium]|nr:aminopeptidase P family protein [Acidimicrobiia bacterium]